MDQKIYTKDMFVLVQENERLLDKKFKTKQLTYFQDAMLRFTKNKYNVTATVILAIMILLSIFVPIITPRNLYLQTNSSLTTLPPRIPLLEQLGIFDGTKEFRDQPIDYSTIDPETGLGYPTIGFQADYFLFDTLTNQDVIGTDRSPQFRGGTNELFVDTERIAYSIVTPAAITFLTGHTIEVNINEIDPAGVLKVYLSAQPLGSAYASWDLLPLIGTITEAGVHVLDPMTAVANGVARYVVFKYELPAVSETGTEYVSFTSIAVKNAADVAVNFYDGYPLAMFPLYTIDTLMENGRFLRKNAIMTTADFRYDVYDALFADQRTTIGDDEYFRILEENEGMEESIVPDPDNPDGWLFGEGYPIVSVVRVEVLSLPGTGITATNYIVMLDGAYALDFESTPYFLFGTDVFGRDLFTLIWLGLRTSLLLGFMAACVNIFIGIIWGATSAYYGGQVDIMMERFTDIWGNFPQITMIAIITVLIGPGFTALFIFMVYDGWIGAAHVTRSQFYRYKGREYVLAARTLGASDSRIIFKHILPNALGTIITRVILSIPSVIFLEVNLSYLGFGIGNGSSFHIGPVELTGTSIGVILNDGQQQIFAGNLWMVIFPTIIVSMLMITFNMFGNALRDALNPQLRGS